jgi:hypothetical protein
MKLPSNSAKYSVALAMLCFLWACGESNHNESSETEAILKSIDGGDFRGVNMGDNPQDVMEREGQSAVYSMPDELVYRLPLSKEDSTWYEISYNFNEAGLYDISMEVFAERHEIIGKIYQECVSHYAGKYGQPTIENGAEQWRAMTEKGNFIWITITDSIQRLNKPCMKINFNELPTQ